MKGLVLSGGGAFGMFQVGCLNHLIESNPELQYDLFSGISVGALHAASLSQYKVLKEGIEWLNNYWDNLHRKDVWKYSAKSFLTDSGLVNSSPLEDMITDNFDKSKIKEANKKLRMGAVDLILGDYKVVTEDDDKLVQWIMASSAFPILFPCIDIDGGYYSDGGVVSLTPLKSAIMAGCDEIDIIQTSPAKLEPKKKEKLKHWWQSAPRILEVALHHSWMKDLKKCHNRNQRTDEGYRYIKINIQTPHQPLPFDAAGFKQTELPQMKNWGFNTKPITLEEFLEKAH